MQGPCLASDDRQMSGFAYGPVRRGPSSLSAERGVDCQVFRTVIVYTPGDGSLQTTEPMNRITNSLILIATAVVVGVPPGLAGREDDQIPPERLAKDINQLLEVLEEVHPNPYYYVSRQQVEEAKAALLSSLERPHTQLEFYPLLARFVAEFEDGHFAVVPPIAGLREHLESGGALFPLDVEQTPGGLIVDYIYDSDEALQVGDHLIAINGLAADSLFNEFLREQSGEPRYRSERACRAFRQLLWIHEIRDPYVIRWTRDAEEEHHLSRLGGVTAAMIEAGRVSRQSPDYRFTVLDGRVGLIDFRSMRDVDTFTTFLKRTFTHVREESVEGVIVDLRRNGGGDSQLGDALLTYLTTKPYRMAARKEWKVSRSYKDYLRELGVENRRYLDAAPGEMLVYEAELRTPAEEPLRFEGPVCFLIGRGTYSSAVMLANAVGDFDLAVLIGEETGGRPNGFGETYRFELVHSKLQVDVSSAMWVRANGDAADRRGVLPDIEIESMSSGYRDAADPVLEYARDWILSRARDGVR